MIGREHAAAEILAVGDELLLGGFADTNSPWLAGRLAALGIATRRVSVVGDDEAAIAAAAAEAAARASLVLVAGGLGPTEDDRTRAGLARALGVALERDASAAEAIGTRLAARGFEAREDQLRQADLPRGARSLGNPVGIAPGLALEHEGTLLVALPGVPAELRGMFETEVVPLLRARPDAPRKRILKVAGRTESSVDRQLRDLYGGAGVAVTILARPSGIELLLRAEQARLVELEAAMAARLADDLFGRDDDTLASVVGRALAERGATLATAESCTAGLLAATVTEVPGSSAWFRGGFVTYSDDLKVALAGVSPATLARHGAVSAEVACELAAGARARCGSDFALAITGVAGPGGGSERKPVGLVFVALADATGAQAERAQLPGDRDLVRRRAVTLALDRLRRRLAG